MTLSDTCCCGLSLQIGARIIGYVDIVLAFATVLSLLFSDRLTNLLNQYTDHAYKDSDITEFIKQVEEHTDKDPDTDVVVVIIGTVLYFTLDVSASALLLYGANYKKISSCQWWFRLRVVILFLFIVYFFTEMGRTRLFLYGVFDILKIFYRIYCLSTVSNFMRKLEKDAVIQSRRRNSIVVPYVQVITPEGSYSALFPTPAEYQNFFSINGQSNGLILSGHEGEQQEDEPPNEIYNGYTRLGD